MKARYRQATVNGKKILLHRHVMQKALGRKLEHNEIVHHKNGDRYDNRPENLELMSPAEHAQHHNQKHALESTCVVCGAVFVPHPTKRARKKTCGEARCKSIATGRNQKSCLPYSAWVHLYEARQRGEQMAILYGISQTTASEWSRRIPDGGLLSDRRGSAAVADREGA